ncbi:hypothetical protein L1987_72549 [Smallanthus sonchifolius]|uniref:Uncharacterized protein n=1 Tax=Smallanthus sonchifolius TaxID=185202 RepID=A0ACB9AVH7_9ASTR|nr:hypothetical protein L1987_72549 [Smallanthus sonchifolius]
MGYCISGTVTSLLPASNPTHNKSFNFSKYTLSASIQRNPIPLVISTTCKWQGNWNADYNFSLRDLRLDDLVEDGDPNNSRVLVSLTIHRVGFGLSVDGKIDTSFTRKCSNCSLPYCRQVIYVKPGCEADLDSLIQDTVRLTTSVNETCSNACEKSELGVKHISKAKAPTVDKRWSKLLELKNSYQ